MIFLYETVLQVQSKVEALRLWDVAGILNITVIHMRACNDTATK